MTHSTTALFCSHRTRPVVAATPAELIGAGGMRCVRGVWLLEAFRTAGTAISLEGGTPAGVSVRGPGPADAEGASGRGAEWGGVGGAVPLQWLLATGGC